MLNNASKMVFPWMISIVTLVLGSPNVALMLFEAESAI